MSLPVVTVDKVIEGLHAIFATLPDLPADKVRLGEPREIVSSDTPVLYTILDRGEPGQAGQVQNNLHRLMHRMVFSWENGEDTEAAMLPFWDALPAAVKADSQLATGESDPRIPLGQARIVEIEAGWDIVGGALYRVLDFYSETRAKR